MIRKFVCMSLLAVWAANAYGADWREVYRSDFEKPGWEATWSVTGGIGPTDQGALVSSGGEMTATLNMTFSAPAVRAEYDATFTATGPDGEISDLSCFLDGVLFQVGGNNNTRTRIKRDQRQSSEIDAGIQLEKTVRVVAEVNGRAAWLSIDGKTVATLLLDEAIPDDTFSFYTWTGVTRFDNLRILIKDEADPLPPELKAAARRGFETPQTLKHIRDWQLPTVSNLQPSTVQKKQVELHIDAGPFGRKIDWPITMGVPMPKDVLWNVDQARVIDEYGREIPSQRSVTATWTRGGSIRWLLLDFILPKGEKPSKLFLEYGNQVKATDVPDPVTVSHDDDVVAVNSGPLKAIFSRRDGSVVDGIFLNGRKVVDRSEAFYVTSKGERYSTFGSDDELSIDVEMAGPIRTVIRSRGWYKNEAGERACAFTRRIYVYRGLPFVRLFTTWTVTVDTNAYKFSDVALRFPLAGKAAQNSSRMYLAAERHKGFDISGPDRQEMTDLADWITWGHGRDGVTLSCYEMSRQWPAALETKSSEIVFHGYTNAAGRNLDMTIEGLKDVWGEEAFKRFELNRKTYPSLMNRNANGCGVAKTHELILAFGLESETAGAMLQAPPIVSVDPAFACATRVVGPGEYHPYDPAQFPEEEAAILKRYQEFLHALDRLDPWYGWWDYGGGIPHYTSKTEDGRVIYTGYRRTYDMGYQRPMVPWNFYLRSGQRAWLTYAIRNARCMMDMHTNHWTNEPLGKHIGWNVADNGTWPWDSYLTGWNFNHYIPYLLLAYHTTGYERAFDVMVEVMDEYYRDVGPGGGSDYCGRVAVWMGNAAAAYRSTWEPKYLEVYRDLEQRQMAAQCQFCMGLKRYRQQKDADHPHGYTHRAGWREYGFLQGLEVPEHDPNLEKVYLDWAETIGDVEIRAPFQVLGFSMLHLFRKRGNILKARYGADSLEQYASYDMVPKYGLAHLRSLPAVMKLALVPGVDRVVLPRTREFPGRVTLRHEKGKQTAFAVDLGQGKPELVDEPNTFTIADIDGRPMPDEWMQLDPVRGKVNVVIPAAYTGSIWIITNARPGSLNIEMLPSTPMMAAIPDGLDFGRKEPDTLWFNVPAGTEQFRVRSNLPNRTVTIVRPDGKEITGKGYWHKANVPADLPAGPWAVRSGYESKNAYFILKLYDIPAMVTFDRDSVFDVPNPTMPTPDFVGVSESAVFVEGALEGDQALLLNGNDKLYIPLGDLIGPTARQRFDAQRGTIEFFFMLNEDPAFSRASGIPFVLPFDEGQGIKTWLNALMSFQYKNAFNILTPNGQPHRPIALGPWNAPPGMLNVEPGRWYHVAIVWDANLSMDVHGKQRKKFMNKAFLDGVAAKNQNLANASRPDPYWLIDGFTMPQPADVIEMFSHQHNIVIDELRVSRVPRARFSDKTYPVPTAPLQRDKDTLILMHFDGNTEFTGPQGETVSAPFANKP